MDSDHQKMSYTVGLKAGTDLIRQFHDLDKEAFKKGFLDAMENRPSTLSDHEIKTNLQQFQRHKAAKDKILLEHMAKKNLEDGEKFLAENKSRNGVKVLSSGLQYEVIKLGNGKAPSMYDTVSVHYKGSFINGQVFENSHDRGQPVELTVNKTIPGFSQALKQMREGDVWKLFIPSYLAYGENGMGRHIQPNTTLIFEIELLKIKTPATVA